VADPVLRPGLASLPRGEAPPEPRPSLSLNLARANPFIEPGLALRPLGVPALVPAGSLPGARAGRAYLAGGLRATWQALGALRDRVIDVDLLMVLAALGAAAIGQAMEGAGLLFLFSLSNALQEHALERTKRSVEALMRLHPQTARVV